MIAQADRRGFTLVELLVVTGLFVVFFGLVVNGLRPNPNSQVRQLSQAISSAILATQTRSLGNDAGAALILDVTSGNAYSNAVFNAEVPPFAEGTITGIPPSSLNLTFATGTLSPANADVSDLATGYKIRFSGTSPFIAPTPWMNFSSAGTATGTVSFRTSANQTRDNTVWPIATSGTLQFAVARLPVKSGPAADVTKFAAVDLRYSGIGNTTWGVSGTIPVAITFDRNGGLDSLMYLGSPASWVTPTSPLYLLIASLPDIQSDQSLQSQTSRWLAINPSTGRVTVAANVVSGTDVNAARANARQGVTGGVK
jgi:prepilin-type N-terminal cleavage/methylation domain-containing protein